MDLDPIIHQTKFLSFFSVSFKVASHHLEFAALKDKKKKKHEAARNQVGATVFSAGRKTFYFFLFHFACGLRLLKSGVRRTVKQRKWGQQGPGARVWVCVCVYVCVCVCVTAQKFSLTVTVTALLETLLYSSQQGAAKRVL